VLADRNGHGLLGWWRIDDRSMLPCQGCPENLTGTVMETRQRIHGDQEKVSVTLACALDGRTACRDALAATRTRVLPGGQHDRLIARRQIDDAATRVTKAG
jgi:hypothetical protein